MNTQPVALVTGGSRGIGHAICVALGTEGFTVLVNYNRDIAAAEQTVGRIVEAGGGAELCQADVAQTEDRDLLLQFCLEKLGRLDLLVNNAGIAPPRRADLLELAEDDYDLLLDTNLKSAMFLSQGAAKIMIAQLEQEIIPRATIINVSSVSAYAASVMRGAYCVSKAGMAMVTKLFAARLADAGIGVFEIRPGIIKTDMTEGVQKKYDQRIKEGLSPIQRWGEPEEVARAVAAVARGDLPFATGEVINIDGGYHLHVL